MELDFFNDQTKVSVNAAFNYAKENNYDYLHILLLVFQDWMMKKKLKLDDYCFD